jgi:DNA-binding response OmpR family regulator
MRSEGEPGTGTRRGADQASDELRRPAITDDRSAADVVTSESAPRPPWVGHLGIEVDESTRTVRRGDKEVELGGHRIQYHLLLELIARGRGYTPPQHLLSVWKRYGQEHEPEIQTVVATISELRKRIKDMGLRIHHARDLGYRLEAV